MYERGVQYVEQDQSLLIVTAGHFSKAGGLKPQDGPTWRYALRAAMQVCVSVASLFTPARAASRRMHKKPLNQRVKYGVSDGRARARSHVRTHSLARTRIQRVCESELSVLLSHTIHHEPLILLDHCRAFRTPRCSLKTQSEANAPQPF